MPINDLAHSAANAGRGEEMKDERGYYYHARPGNPDFRVYVRKGANGFEFRMWDRERPEVWEKHKWLDYDTISAAARLYQSERNPDANPLAIYDLAIAKNLLAGEPD